MKLKLLFLSLLLITPVLAEEPKCSFGSSPLTTTSQSFPGGEIVIPWSVYNYYGDRPTITNFTVVEDNGLQVSVPKGIILQPNSSSSKNFVSHPVSGAKVPAEEVLVRIKVPEDFGENRLVPVRIVANAHCNLDSGMIIPGIQTDLKILVNVLSEQDYYSLHPKNYALQAIGFLVLAVLVITGFLLFKSKINNSRLSRN